MKLDCEKVEIVKAKRKMSNKDIFDKGLAKTTFQRAMRGENCLAKTVGTLAAILDVNVEEIIQKEVV